MKLFISYRRQDSTVITGRIYDRLVTAFGDRTVFRDIDDIPAGKDFRAVLESEVGKSDIMLVIIGPQWAAIADGNGNKRLFDPNDFVRIEVESGLKNKDVLVIPLLALGASMPTANELPESLRELLYRNALIVRNDPDFYNDMGRLIREIKGTEPVTKRIVPKLGVGFILTAVLALLIFSGIKILNASSEQDNTTPSSDVTTPILNSDPAPTKSLNGVNEIAVGAGFGARGNGWQLYFTNPANSQDPVSLVDTTKLINMNITASRGISIYQEPNQDSMITARLSTGDSFLIVEANAERSWMRVQLQDVTQGWALTEDIVLVSATPLAPSATSKYGINIRLVDAIGRVKNNLDIAAFTFDEKEITKAVLEAHQNGVTVRIVTDDEDGLGDPDSSFQQFIDSGIPVVTDERSALMHDKFMILDNTTVWTGSWNYADNSTFNNNENVLVFASPEIASLYLAEFNKMFEQGQFGAKKSSNVINEVNLADGSVRVYFTPEDKVESELMTLLASAQISVRLLAFSFTHDGYRSAILSAMERGVKFQGIVEKTGWLYGEFPSLFCAGADTRSDGNPHYLHHNVIIIDDSIVITGSMNFSMNALESNDENALIISNTALAAAYNDEFERLWDAAQKPTDFSCTTPTP